MPCQHVDTIDDKHKDQNLNDGRKSNGVHQVHECESKNGHIDMSIVLTNDQHGEHIVLSMRERCGIQSPCSQGM